MVFKQGGTFIVPYLLRDGASVLSVLFEGPLHLVALYDRSMLLGNYSSPDLVEKAFKFQNFPTINWKIRQNFSFKQGFVLGHVERCDLLLRKVKKIIQDAPLRSDCDGFFFYILIMRSFLFVPNIVLVQLKAQVSFSGRLISIVCPSDSANFNQTWNCFVFCFSFSLLCKDRHKIDTETFFAGLPPPPPNTHTSTHF